jgi:hypothetical protein
MLNVLSRASARLEHEGEPMATAKKGSGRAANLSAVVLIEQKAGGRLELSIPRKNINIVVELGGKGRISVMAPRIHKFSINGKSFDNGSGVSPSGKG